VKRTPLQRKTPLKRKRATPRRDKIQHTRMKRRATDTNEIEQIHLDRIRSLPCAVPGCNGVSVPHHLMKAPDKRCRRDHRWTAPLCPNHHNLWNDSVHLLGSEEKFRQAHGVDLLAIAAREWAATNNHIDAKDSEV